MAERPLNPEEAALWRRVVETVRPATGRSAPPAASPAKSAAKPNPKPMPATPAITVAPRKTGNPATLDGTWDRQLGKGIVAPDRSIDLHGDTLARAYGRIDAALADAIAAGDRVLLLVTGKPGGERQGRGAIRAVVHDWLAASRHASRIAAVRNAHPRHGGVGALYVVLRRPR